MIEVRISQDHPDQMIVQDRMIVQEEMIAQGMSVEDLEIEGDQGIEEMIEEMIEAGQMIEVEAVTGDVMIETMEDQVAEAGLMIVAEMIEAGMTAVEVMIETEGEGQMIEVEGGQMTEADLMTKVGQRIEAVGMTRDLNLMTKGGQRV